MMSDTQSKIADFIGGNVEITMIDDSVVRRVVSSISISPKGGIHLVFNEAFRVCFLFEMSIDPNSENLKEAVAIQELIFYAKIEFHENHCRISDNDLLRTRGIKEIILFIASK